MRLATRSPLLWIIAASALAAFLWAAVPSKTPPLNLAADLPPGALMTLESPDFSSLLTSWMQSPQQRAWLNSANYSAFANSRLFSRLADAQSGFADAAHTGLNSSFLQQVAGRESIFAWYDIGNLEFLYITHLSDQQVAALSLLQQRSNFIQRESAGTPFYLRTATAAADTSSTDNTVSSQTLTQPRTVAFAVRGDWLLLATREDLIANALQLMASPGGTKAAPDSEANVGWFAAASAAGPTRHGDLHMLLDLQSLTKTPQFRTYWIQRNVTATRQFRAAVVDLYREPDRFREERVLLPMQPLASSGQADLGQLEALVPERIGVYRAVAKPTPDLVVSTLNEKLLLSSRSVAPETSDAPAPEAALTPAGTLNDLDIRIDAPQPRPETPADALVPLRHVLDTAQIESMLTLERTDPVAADLPFVHIHSAVVLRATAPWNTETLAQALGAALGPRLTTASLGLKWHQVPSQSGAYLALTDAQPFALFTDGPLAILSNDPRLLSDILAERARHATPQPAQFIAGMIPGEEKATFHHLTTQLGQGSAPPEGSSGGNQPQLFRDNLASLADTFSSLHSEHIVARYDGAFVRQTVVYNWAASPILQ